MAISPNLPNSLFTRTELAGPYRLTSPRNKTLADELAQAALPLIDIAPSATSSTTEWLVSAGQQLHFPAHFGANFDALFDCLCDREILPQTILILRLRHTDALDEEGVDTLIAVLQAAADEWREQGRGLWALFDAPALDLDPLPAPKA